MSRFGPVLLALLAGAALASQGAINAELARHIGQWRAVLFSVLISTLIVLIVIALRAGDGSYKGLTEAPRWALIGGGCGVLVLFGSVVAVPRIGSAATTGAIVCAQISVSALLDHFGVLGVAVRHLTPGRLGGLALLIAGVLLVVNY